MRLVLYSGPQRPGITPPSYGDSTHLYTQPYTSVWNRRGTAWSHTGSQNMVNVYHTHTHTRPHTYTCVTFTGWHTCVQAAFIFMNGREMSKQQKAVAFSVSLLFAASLQHPVAHPFQSAAIHFNVWACARDAYSAAHMLACILCVYLDN